MGSLSKPQALNREGESFSSRSSRPGVSNFDFRLALKLNMNDLSLQVR
jgi:hypothetical protein